VITVYREDDRRKYLDNLFRLQIVAGQYADAIKTLAALRALRAKSVSPQDGATDVQYEVFARAMQRAAGSHLEVEELRRAFHEVIAP